MSYCTPPNSSKFYGRMQRTPDKNFMHIVQTMGRVQECPWQPFKLNEIVTLEKCLQELSQQDPRFNLLLRKLSSESHMVEQAKKLQHLNRTKQEEQQDGEFKRCALETAGQISNIEQQISFYKVKLDECLESEKEMRLEIIQMEKSIQAVEKIYKLLLREFSLSLDRVYNSFTDSVATLELVPNYLESIGRSKLVTQTDSLPVNYRKRLLRLTTTPNAPAENEVKYTYLELAIRRLVEHTKFSSHLLMDLTLIVKLYSTELLVEQDHLKALEGHIDYLRKPVCESPPRVVVRSAASETFKQVYGADEQNQRRDEIDVAAAAEAEQAIDDLQALEVAGSKLGEIFDSIRLHTQRLQKTTTTTRPHKG